MQKKEAKANQQIPLVLRPFIEVKKEEPPETPDATWKSNPSGIFGFMALLGPLGTHGLWLVQTLKEWRGPGAFFAGAFLIGCACWVHSLPFGKAVRCDGLLCAFSRTMRPTITQWLKASLSATILYLAISPVIFGLMFEFLKLSAEKIERLWIFYAIFWPSLATVGMFIEYIFATYGRAKADGEPNP